MRLIKIGTTDVILKDDEISGRGKIIISDSSYGYNFSYFWGSMGCTLTEFLKDIDSHYFTKNLGTNLQEFNADKSFAAIRSEIKKNIPWYKHTEFQKDMRQRLMYIQEYNCYGQESFVHELSNFVDRFDWYLIDKYDRDELKDELDNIFSEPWHYIVLKESRENIWLQELHKKLKEIL